MKKVMLVLLAIAVVASGCASIGGSAGRPRVVVDSPTHGARVRIGQTLSITVTALGKKGIKRVVMSVDGKPAGAANTPGGKAVKALPVVFKWTPTSPGMHVITVKAYDVAGKESDPAILQVSVDVGTVVAQPTSISVQVPGMLTSAPTKRAASSPVSAVITPKVARVTPSGSAAGSGKGNRPYLVTLVNLNVRSGPGTDYPVVGRLSQGERALINGKSVDGSWWRIEFPAGTGAYGWVSAYYVTPHNADNVPVVQAPLPPPTPTWTPSHVPLTPRPGVTGETEARGRVVIKFAADKTSLQVGQCTDLHWLVDNVSAVYLDGAGVTGHGDKRVCPGSTTTYTLHVVKRDGSSEDRRVTITVVGSP